LLLQFLALALVLVVSLAANLSLRRITHRVATALLLLITYPEPQQLLTAFWFGPIDWTLPERAVVVGPSSSQRYGTHDISRSRVPTSWRAIAAGPASSIICATFG